MIPAPFDYLRPRHLDEALAALATHDDAKVLAGGHSLLPLMKLRFATPATLIDIGALRELSYINSDGDQLSIGALTRHHDLATSATLASFAPLLHHAAAKVGDPQVRHRGTIGGSLAHGDPASDLAAVVLALGGSVVLRGVSQERIVPAAEFFVGFLTTVLRPDELVIEIRVPRQLGGWGFQKFNRRAQDWAIVGVAVGSTTAGLGIGLVNMGLTTRRAEATEAALIGGASATVAAQLADEGCSPIADLHASEDYRRHLARVLTRRALESAGY